MKSTFCLALLLICLVKPCLGQNPAISNNSGLILGNVKDSLYNIAIDFADVSLHQLDMKTISTTLTDKAGNFQFTNIPFGSYYVVVNFVGYKQLKTTIIVISEISAKIDLGSLLINQYIRELNITVQKQIIKISQIRLHKCRE
ncbi:MAG: carboxypeptidase regulatory-like domain-containing protein [Pedobacter sp.]|nr:MAG: carboxypeptidase regulatory-like domain-containing protein [Pedobacter sp.]